MAQFVLKEWKVEQLDELQQVAVELIQSLGDRRKIALYGDMGAGKTTFVKAFCAALGVESGVFSPTFSLINSYEYKSEDGGYCQVHHLDLYRLETAEEALDIGIEEVLYDVHYCIIEWPQVVEAYLPTDCAKIRIEHTAGQTRLISWYA